MNLEQSHGVASLNRQEADFLRNKEAEQDQTQEGRKAMALTESQLDL